MDASASEMGMAALAFAYLDAAERCLRDAPSPLMLASECLTAVVVRRMFTVLAECAGRQPRPRAVHAGHGAVVERPQRRQRVRGGVEARLRGPRGVAERRPRRQAGREPLYCRLRMTRTQLKDSSNLVAST